MDMLDKAIAILLLAALVFTVLAHGAVEPWSIALFEFAALGLILLWGIKAAAAGRFQIRVSQAALAFAALVAIGLIQSVAFGDGSGRISSLSFDVEATRSSVLALSCLLICFLVASNFFVTRDRLRALAHFLVIFGFCMAVFGLVQHFAWNGRFYWLRTNHYGASPFGPFVNHNHFAGFMDLLMPVPAALVITRGVRGETRLFYGFAAAIMGIATIASLSRGGIVSLLGGLVFLAVMGSRLKGAGAVAAVAGVIAIGVLWVGLDPVVNRIAGQADKGGETFFTSRGWLWRDTASLIQANPILGVGMGAFQTAYPIYSKSDGALQVGQSHNDYLQVLADFGVAGMAAAAWFIVSIGRAFRFGIKSRDRLLAGLALGGGAGIFAMLVHSLFDFNLQIPSNALLFLLLTAVVSHIGGSVATARAERGQELPLNHSVDRSRRLSGVSIG